MTVVVSKREVGVCRQEFEIEVPAAEVDAEYLRVARDYRRRARIDGFRKGKAPLDLVRQRFAGSIGEDVPERLAPKYWRKARDEEDVHAMLPPSVAPVQAEPGQPLRFTVTVDVEPDVEIDESRTFSLPQAETEPSELEVDELLEQLRLQRSTWVPVERTAARGDRVRGRIHRAALPGYDPPPAAEGGDRDAAREQDPRGPATHAIDLELGDERAWPELTDNLTGLSAGLKAGFRRTEMDEDVERQRLYEIEVEEVLERKLPEVNDEWASSLASTIDTVDDLRGQLRDQVRAQKTEQAGNQRADALLDQLRERYPATLPEAVVEREAVQMARSYATNLARQGVDLERQQLPWDQLMEKIRPQAPEAGPRVLPARPDRPRGRGRGVGRGPRTDAGDHGAEPQREQGEAAPRDGAGRRPGDAEDRTPAGPHRPGPAGGQRAARARGTGRRRGRARRGRRGLERCWYRWSSNRPTGANGPTTSTRACSRTTSCSWAGRSTTTWRTWSSRRCSSSSPRTRRRTSPSTSTRRAAR